MIPFELIASILFFAALTFFISIKRKNLETKEIFSNFYFSMYRTSWGLKSMDSLAGKYKKALVYIGYFGIFIGFLGMIFIVFTLISGIFTIFQKPEASPPVGLVLPIPVNVPGIFGIPFSYWIISIFVIASVHEFSHGLIARTYNIRVKSSGFAFIGISLKTVSFIAIILPLLYKLKITNYNFSAFFYNLNFFDFYSPDFWLLAGFALLFLSTMHSFWVPIIPAAFVEPDEKEMKKRNYREQLSVFAAGPLANILTGFVFLAILLFALYPAANAIIEPDGVIITKYVEGKEKFPAESYGMKIGEVIKQADGKPTPYVKNLSMILAAKKPNDFVAIKTDKSLYEVKLASNPKNESSAYIGAYLEQNIKIKDFVKANYGNSLASAFLWLLGLVEMLITLNLGIGLFNLLPFGPLDGGRMFQLPLHRFFGKKKGDRILRNTGMFFLIILFIYLSVIFKNIIFYFIK